MAELIRVPQGTVIALDTCPGCGGPIQWKPTRNGDKVHVYCTNNHTDAAHFGERCGRRLLPSVKESQELLAAYQAAGKPLDLRETAPKPTKEPTDDRHGNPGDRDDDDTGGGILGWLTGDD